MEEIKVNLDNLTNEERETLLKLVEKGNKTNKKRWRSKRNNKYYSISNCGDLISDIEYGCGFDESSYQLGNYFKTEKEAELARDKQLIYQQLKDYALEYNIDEVDWNNYQQEKWYISFNAYSQEITINSTQYGKNIGQVYFTSEEIARAAVKEVGEDNIKKYLFGVNE